MTPLDEEQKKRQTALIVGVSLISIAFAFLITKLVHDSKYAKLESKFWGM